MSPQSFTGRGRRRQTRRRVRIAERVARVMISIGGIGTILAVTLIMVFLVWVVVPLFAGADFERRPERALASIDAAPLATAVDEYQVLSWGLFQDGTLRVWRLDNGELVESRRPFGERTLSALSLPGEGNRFAFGFEDGSVATGRIDFSTAFAELAPDDELSRALGTQERATVGATVAQRTGPTQARVQALDFVLEPPVASGATTAITTIDAAFTGDSARVLACERAGRLWLSQLENKENPFTGETKTSAATSEVALTPRADGTPPWRVLVAGAGDRLFAVWQDGFARRFDARDLERVVEAEELDLAGGDARLSALGFLIGKNTLVVGDTRGRVDTWFGVRPDAAGTVDGVHFVRTHTLSDEGPEITALGISARGRSIVIGAADGSLRLYYVTSQKLLFEERTADGARIDALAISPKDDGVSAFAGGKLATWRMDLLHPEASFAALFTPVWYEGYVHPENVWQSSSGTDDFEAKLGLIPLIFGTLKATFYSMLFGVPLAILAAIYTSEFLDPRLKTALKSMTEMMASLPSVVLGFLAAIIFAPYIQGIVPAVLTGFFTIPLALLTGAYLWQLLPGHLYIRLSGTPRFAAIALALPIGILAAAGLGPIVERALFAGDIALWLDHQRGNSVGGWLFLLLPVCALLFVFFGSRWIDPWWRSISRSWDRPRAARFDLLKFVVVLVSVFGLAYGAAHALDFAGFDARGGVLDTYVQRNALIVGFVMGFAIIPLIYTLAEDALSSVPSHLRMASLGAGATPWQTAVRVVIPTAMSGLFSAGMVGLGRAVGETMIVLMATGNTPVMSWNVFDGFRTLSANIAVELPEAVKDSTHYRTLFLAALCLFALTFALNTLAEVVRQRFRKRAYQL